MLCNTILLLLHGVISMLFAGVNAKMSKARKRREKELTPPPHLGFEHSNITSNCLHHHRNTLVQMGGGSFKVMECCYAQWGVGSPRKGHRCGQEREKKITTTRESFCIIYSRSSVMRISIHVGLLMDMTFEKMKVLSPPIRC